MAGGIVVFSSRYILERTAATKANKFHAVPWVAKRQSWYILERDRCNQGNIFHAVPWVAKRQTSGRAIFFLIFEKAWKGQWLLRFLVKNRRLVIYSFFQNQDSMGERHWVRNLESVPILKIQNPES